MQQKYIAFLRGINVGNIRIKMSDLQKAVEGLGFKAVKTYLQTGNIVFETDKNSLEIKSILEQHLTQTFHYEAFVLIYSFDALPSIIANYPFERDETHHDYVIFTETNAVQELLIALGQKIENEKCNIALGENVLYWKVQKEQTLNTAFAKILAKAAYKSTTTTRNLNTLEKMIL
jgi:uncharacterized protein (DUF1697 family)